MRAARCCLTIAALLFAAWPCIASGADPAASHPRSGAPAIWLNAGTLSHHFDRDRSLREDNVGVGAEFSLSRGRSLLAGTFINSDRTRSRYAAYAWRPLAGNAGGLTLDLGVAVGALDGYPHYREGDWFAAVLPMLSIEHDRVGVNLFVIPTIRNRLHGAVAVQVKVRVW